MRSKIVDASLSEADLLEFTIATDTSQIERGRRLLELAHQLKSQLNWKSICLIHQTVVDEEPSGGLYVSWLFLALDWYILEDSNLSIAARFESAEESCRLAAKALELSPNDPCFAVISGMLNYKHPGRSSNEPNYLRTAANWFQTADEWHQEEYNEPLDDAILYLGHCWFELGEFPKALAPAMKKVRHAEISDDLPLLLERMKLCL